MKQLVEGQERSQVTLLPECREDFIAEDNPVRVVDAFVEELDLPDLGFGGVEPALTGRPSYHPAPGIAFSAPGRWRDNNWWMAP